MIGFKKIRIIVCLLIGAILIACFTQAKVDGADQFAYSKDVPLSEELQFVVYEASEKFGVPVDLLFGVMAVESSFDVNAYNDECYGLMQVNIINRKSVEQDLVGLGVSDVLNNPRDNIIAGAYLLGSYFKKYGDWHKALMCYNFGEAGAWELWKEGHLSSRYSRKVFENAILYA